MGLIRASQLDTSPVAWTIDEMIPDLGIGFVYGPKQEGKSLVAQAMSLSVANDLPFMKRRSEGGSVVYCLGEGVADAGVRLAATKMAAAYDGVALKTERLLFELEHFSLTSKVDVERMIKRWGILDDLQLVFLDVISYYTGGRSLGNDQSATMVMKGARKISDELGCTVVMVAHPLKNEETMRGNGVLENLADFVINVSSGAISCQKQKSGGKFSPMGFEIDPVAWNDPETGSLVKSAIIRMTSSGLDEIAEGPEITSRQVVRGFLADAIHRNGLQTTATRVALEMGIPLSTLRLGDAEEDAVDADVVEEPEPNPLTAGLPELIRGIDAMTGRRRKRTGILPGPPGRVTIG